MATNFVLVVIVKGQFSNINFLAFFFPSLSSHREEVYQEFQPSYDIFPQVWCQGLFRAQQVPCNPSRHYLIANSASTQSQQPVL